MTTYDNFPFQTKMAQQKLPKESSEKLDSKLLDNAQKTWTRPFEVEHK